MKTCGGIKLVDWRTARGWSQADLAKALGISQAYVCRLETGERVPSHRIMTIIADYTGGEITPNDFCVWSPTLEKETVP
jgi:transcriptional regulator with XRE-family HTH domain